MILTRTSPLPYFAKLIVSRIDFVCVFHSHQLISVWKLLCAGVRLPVFRNRRIESVVHAVSESEGENTAAQNS